MASPQVEDGHLKIADALVVAICRGNFTANQIKVLLAIMNMTYRVGKTKAEITIDDLRYATNEKRYLIEQALDNLIARNVVFEQRLRDGGRLYGLQKDFDRWISRLPKNGSPITNVIAESNTNTPIKGVPKNGKTPPGQLLIWMLEQLGLQLSESAWRAEYAKAVKLYTQALDLAHTPSAAGAALRDYFLGAADVGFRAKVIRPASYLLPGFSKWYKSIPEKPRNVLEDEQITGYKYRYNLNNKRWEVSDESI